MSLEFNLDWKAFRRVFYPQRRVGGMREAAATDPAYLVVDSDRIVSAFAESEDLTDLRGVCYGELVERTTHRDLVAFDRAEVDLWFQEAIREPHYYGQVEAIRRAARPASVVRPRLGKRGVPAHGSRKDWSLEVERHFLLEALHGWWSKVLPSAYGVYVRLDLGPGRTPRDFIAVTRRGQFECLATPDLSSLSAERRADPEQLVKYLSEKYLVPVQGVWARADEWYAWSDLADPWKQVAQSLRQGALALHPFRMSVAFLISTRGYLGI